MGPLNVPYSRPLGFDALNFTQRPLQPSSADLWLSPHSLINKLLIFIALGQWLPKQTKKRAAFLSFAWMGIENWLLALWGLHSDMLAHPVPTKAFL